MECTFFFVTFSGYIFTNTLTSMYSFTVHQLLSLSCDWYKLPHATIACQYPMRFIFTRQPKAIVYIILVYILYYNVGIPSMSENCHPKTIHLVWLFLAVERQHSTRLTQAIHLGKEETFTALVRSVNCLLGLNPQPGVPGRRLTLQNITTLTKLIHCVKTQPFKNSFQLLDHVIIQESEPFLDPHV